MTQPFTRANFRIVAGQGQIAPGALTSLIAAVSTSGTTDASGVLTISMGGMGAPSMWIAAAMMSNFAHATFLAGAAAILAPTQSFSGSIGAVVLYLSGIAASLASIRVLTTALIGSIT